MSRVGPDGDPAVRRYLSPGAGGPNEDRELALPGGDVAASPPQRWAADDSLLAEVGRLVRRLHDASLGYRAEVGFAAPEGSVWLRDTVAVDGVPGFVPELIAHNDVTPQNVVVRGGRAVALIDFDLVGPTTRLRDVLNTALHWVPFAPPEDVWPDWQGVDQPARLRLLADGYGLGETDRRRLVGEAIGAAQGTWLRMRAAADQLGGGWARMWAEGVGDRIRRREAWLTDRGDDLTAALLA